MSTRINDLLMATLQRAGTPMASDDLVDAATGEGLNAGWGTEHLSSLTRASVAARLRGMEDAGWIKRDGFKTDGHRRPVPLYMPCSGWDARAALPDPPHDEPDPTERQFDGMPAAQMYALLEVQDEVIGAVARHMREMQEINARARRRLAAAGLEVD